MTYLLLFVIFSGDPIPIKVDPGDFVPDIKVTSLANGTQTTLDDVFNDGFTFFLTPKCDYCRTGMDTIKEWRKDHELIFVYLGEKADILKFIEKHQGDLGNSFIADPEDLQDFGLVTFPAALVFKDGRCKVAMHGPLHHKNLGILESFYAGAKLMKKTEM